MDRYILTVDDRNELEAVAHMALSGSNLKLFAAPDLLTAKRKLVSAKPELVLCRLSMGGDSEAGAKFCAELTSHEAFKSVPVLLVVEELSGQTIAVSSENGAAGAVPWPIDAEHLRGRLGVLIPELATVREDPQEEEMLPHMAFADTSAEEEELSAEDKFRMAQRMLAQVLHNLKTSDLLQVAGEEDVPRIVYEMCRTVCGFSGEVAPPPEPKVEEKEEAELDLDKIFGPK